jgi:hypothetical protein
LGAWWVGAERTDGPLDLGAWLGEAARGLSVVREVAAGEGALSVREERSVLVVGTAERSVLVVGTAERSVLVVGTAERSRFGVEGRARSGAAERTDRDPLVALGRERGAALSRVPAVAGLRWNPPNPLPLRRGAAATARGSAATRVLGTACREMRVRWMGGPNPGGRWRPT